MGKFVIKQAKDGQFFFSLKATNGQVILSSEMYTTLKACENGIASVKKNAPELLEKALRSKRKKCMIGTGSMTDPYIPLELEIGNVRKALSLIYEYGYGFTVITKSNRIMRDIDLLEKINQKTKCVVQMTLTTYDEELCRKIEPNVSTTAERFEVLKQMRDAGIPTVVWLTPILPFINDTEENILGILNMCIEAKVYGIICLNSPSKELIEKVHADSRMKLFEYQISYNEI